MATTTMTPEQEQQIVDLMVARTMAFRARLQAEATLKAVMKTLPEYEAERKAVKAYDALCAQALKAFMSISVGDIDRLQRRALAEVC